MKEQHVAVIGGGISGLITAFFLSQKAAREKLPLKITLLESSGRFGGVIRTLTREGLRIEAGADAFDAFPPDAVELCADLGLEAEVVEAAPCFRRFFILKNKKLIHVPGSFSSFRPVSLLRDPSLGFSTKLRLLLEPFIGEKKDPADESLSDFICRRLGHGFYEEKIRPLVQGVYMTDPAALSVEAVFPELKRREKTYGSLTRAAWAERSREKNGRFLNLKGGLETLCGALVRRLEDCELKRSSPVNRLEKDAAGWKVFLEKGETILADAVCLAMNACAAAPLLRQACPAVFEGLNGIRYDSILTMNFIFQNELSAHLREPFGFAVPSGTGEFPFSSLKWFGHPSDQGYRCFRAFISEKMLPDVFRQDEEVLETKILKILEEIFGIKRPPVSVVKERYPKALPQYEVGHCIRIIRIEQELQKHPGLFLAGNAFYGFGISDCIHSAKTGAERIFVYGKSLNHVK